MAKPVYALVGADSFLQLQELARILRDMPADVQRADFDGETAPLAEILDELRSFAMFGGDKLVTIRNADAFVTKYRSQLEDYVAEPSSSGVLVLRLSSLPGNQKIHKLIQKHGAVVSCEPPKDLANWAIANAKAAQKVALAPDAARLLVDLIGDDLGRLDTEIAKLAINADNGKVTADVVTSNVAFTREREMWDLTNAMAAGNTAEALRRWRQLVQSDPSTEFRAVTWLGIWLGEVGLVVNEGPRSPAVGKLRWKYKNDAFDKFVAGATALGKEGYAHALDLLTEIDKQSKSGVGDAAENVERFILSLGAGIRGPWNRTMKHLPAADNFLKLDDEAYCSYENSRFVVYAAPYEHTSSYRAGSKAGPEAIIRASHYVELYDEESDSEPYRKGGICTLSALDFAGKVDEAAMALIAARTSQLLGDQKFPIMLGAEHTVTLGAVRACAEVYKRLTVLQIDAHSDLRDSYDGNRYSHASVMARVFELGVPLTQVGIRAQCREEAEFIRANPAIHTIYAHQLKGQPTAVWVADVVAHLSEEVYVTIDADGFDPSIIPAVGTAEPNGLTWDEGLTLLRSVFKSRRVVGLDVVEIAPAKESTLSEYTLAKLVYKLIAAQVDR